ncbi:MAG: helix-turn-helix domain-containing protein [Polyangiaceae bacterium]|nr:helix-turn-helix domain-containing protein [Polyangiaceae bacterium]
MPSTNEDIDSKYINASTAARRYGLPIGTIHALVSQGRIPHVRLGPRFVRFEVAELDAWFEQHRVHAGTRPPRVNQARAPGRRGRK